MYAPRHPHSGAKLENSTPAARLRALTVHGVVTVSDAEWHGCSTVTLTYRNDGGHVAQSLVCRNIEPSSEVEQSSRAHAFDGALELFRLAAAEAQP